MNSKQTISVVRLELGLEALRGGSHRVVLEIPQGVGAVKVVAREVR